MKDAIWPSGDERAIKCAEAPVNQVQWGPRIHAARIREVTGCLTIICDEEDINRIGGVEGLLSVLKAEKFQGTAINLIACRQGAKLDRLQANAQMLSNALKIPVHASLGFVFVDSVLKGTPVATAPWSNYQPQGDVEQLTDMMDGLTRVFK